jgi:hypothetical protein
MTKLVHLDKPFEAGDIVMVADMGCMDDGEHVVHIDEEGLPYLECESGRHYLDGPGADPSIRKKE